MRRKTNFGLFGGLTILLLIQISACKHDPFIIEDDDMMVIDTTDNPVDTMMTGDPCDPEVVYFELDILPILVSNCAFSGCHNEASAQDGVVLTSYEKVMETAEVSPFDLSEGDLYENITEDDLDKRMPPPPNAPLSAAQVNLIAKWILQGAENLSCDPNAGECNTVGISYTQDVRPVLQNSCVGCHSGSPPAANIDLSSHAGVAEIALNGRLVGAISHDPAYSAMPQGGSQLPSCVIDQITAWVNDGAPNN